MQLSLICKSASLEACTSSSASLCSSLVDDRRLATAYMGALHRNLQIHGISLLIKTEKNRTNDALAIQGKQQTVRNKANFLTGLVELFPPIHMMTLAGQITITLLVHDIEKGQLFLDLTPPRIFGNVGSGKESVKLSA